MNNHIYIITGRVHPERCAVNISELCGKATMDAIMFDWCVKVEVSQVTVRLSANQRLDMESLRNSCQAMVAHIVDSLGWVYGCGWSVELTTVISCSESITFGVSLPVLTKLANPESEFHRIYTLLFEDSDGKMLPLRRALADFRQAILDVFDAPFYCFRAVEALSYYWDRNPRKSTPKLCKALRIDKDWLQKTLEIPAGEIRHGKLRSVTASERDTAIIASREIIQRFIDLCSRKIIELPESEYALFKGEYYPDNTATINTIMSENNG